MTALPLALAVLLAASPKASPAAEGPEASFAAGQSAFARAEFEKALEALNAAAADTPTDQVDRLVQIHLLRGQSFAALKREGKAEEAFLRALELDPEASLDPSKVRPAVVAILDELRARALGDLEVQGDVAGAEVLLDGKVVGTVPYVGQAPIGRRVVQLRGKDGRTSPTQEVVLRIRAPQKVALRLEPLPAEPATTSQPLSERLTIAGLRPFVDLRGAVEPVPPSGTGLSGGAEIGVGLGGRYLLGSLHAGVGGRSFAMALRATGQLPRLVSIVGLHVSLDVPAMLVAGKLAPGIGAGAGVDLAIARWIEPFVEVQYRHYFLLPDGYRPDCVLVGLGGRLRLP